MLVAAHQQVTRKWWKTRRQKFDLYVSELVLTEARAGDVQIAQQRIELIEGLPLLPVTGAILELAERLIDTGPIPRKATRDAIHIAVARVSDCKYLLIWNCRHIANAELETAIRRVLERYGYEMPVLCTPEKLMGGGRHGG